MSASVEMVRGGAAFRYNFPLEWSPSVSHKGFEDLSFAPGFDDVASPEYHSYLILWWLDGKVALTADKLQTEMVTYFRGLAEQRRGARQRRRHPGHLDPVGYCLPAPGRESFRMG